MMDEYRTNHVTDATDQFNILKLRRMIVDSQSEEADILDVHQQLNDVMKFSQNVADEANEAIEESEKTTSRRYFSLVSNEDVTIEYGPEIELAESFIQSKRRGKKTKYDEQLSINILLANAQDELRTNVVTPEAFKNIKSECQRLQDYIGNLLEEHATESDKNMVKLLTVGSNVAQSIIAAKATNPVTKKVITKLPSTMSPKSSPKKDDPANEIDPSNPPNSMKSFLIGNVVQYKKDANDQKILQQLEKTLQLVEKMQDQIPSRENSPASRYSLTLTASNTELHFPSTPLDVQLSTILEQESMPFSNQQDEDAPPPIMHTATVTGIPPVKQGSNQTKVIAAYNADYYFQQNQHYSPPKAPPSNPATTNITNTKISNLASLTLQQQFIEPSAYGMDYGVATASVLLSNEMSPMTTNTKKLMTGSQLEDMDSGKYTRNAILQPLNNGSIGSASGNTTSTVIGNLPSTASSIPTRASVNYGSRQSMRSYFDTSITPRKPTPAKDITSPYLIGTYSVTDDRGSIDSFDAETEAQILSQLDAIPAGEETDMPEYPVEVYENNIMSMQSMSSQLAAKRVTNVQFQSNQPTRPMEPPKSSSLHSPNKRHTVNMFKSIQS